MSEPLFCTFLLVGPDPSLRPLEGADTKSQGCVFLNNLLSTTYSAATLASFPPKLPDYVPPSIWLFALPRAIRYSLSSDSNQPECFSFAVSSRSGITLFGTSLTYMRPVDPQIQAKVTDEEYSPLDVKLFAPYTVCLLSRLPLMSLGRRWMVEIAKLFDPCFKGGVSTLPLESYLWNMIGASRCPPEGHTLMINTPSGGVYPLYRPTEWEFPLLDMPLGHIFMCLDLRSVILLVLSLYQERRVLLVSKRKTLLFYVAHTLVSLIFPLWWNYTYIPVLPDRLMNFVTSDRPYILGIHPDAMARDEVKGQIGKVMIANLDENTISVPPGVAEPPEYEVTQLEKTMDCILQTNLNDMDSVGPLPSNEPPRIPRFEEAIKTAFLQFFLSLFGEFRHFLLFMVEQPKTVAYLEAHKLIHYYLGLAERRRSASGRRRMGWSILSVPLEGDGDESSDEDDEAWEHENFDMKPVPAVGDRHSRKDPFHALQLDAEIENIYTFYMKVVKTKMFWHFCQKYSHPGNTVVDLWAQHAREREQKKHGAPLKRKPSSASKEEEEQRKPRSLLTPEELDGVEQFKSIIEFIERNLSTPTDPSPRMVEQGVVASNLILQSPSPYLNFDKLKKKKKFSYEEGFPTSLFNSLLEASQNPEVEGAFVRIIRSADPIVLRSSPSLKKSDLPYIRRPKELKAKKLLETFLESILKHSEKRAMYDYFSNAVAVATSLSAFPIRRDIALILNQLALSYISKQSGSGSGKGSSSSQQKVECCRPVFELLGAIVECALLQCQERKDMQTAMILYRVAASFVLKKPPVNNKKEKKISEEDEGEDVENDEFEDAFADYQLSLRDKFSTFSIWFEEELWISHLADRIQPRREAEREKKKGSPDDRPLFVRAIVEEAIEMLHFGIPADKVKAVVDWCSKTSELSSKDCSVLLSTLEEAVMESQTLRTQIRLKKKKAQELFLKDIRRLGMDKSDWLSLLSSGQTLKFTSGDVIMKFEDQLNCLYVVKKGTVRVEKVGANQATMTVYLEQDRIFGEMCLLDQNSKAAATVTAAAERTDIIAISRSRMFELFERRPDLTTAVARSLAISLSNALKHQQDDKQIFSPPVRQRKKSTFKKADAIARYNVSYATKLVKKKGIICVLLDGLYFLSDKKQKTVKKWLYQNLTIFKGDKTTEMILEEDSQHSFVLKMQSVKELEELTSFITQGQQGWGGHQFRGDIITALQPKERTPNIPDRRTPHLLTLGDEDWNWLLHMTQCVTYHRDDVIIEEGSRQRRLIQIGSGFVRIVKKADNSSESSTRDSYDEDFSDISTDTKTTSSSEMVLGRMGFGEVLGTINFLESGGATASVIADDATVDIYILEGPVVDLLIATRKGFGGRFYTFLCSELMDCLAQRMK